MRDPNEPAKRTQRARRIPETSAVGVGSIPTEPMMLPLGPRRYQLGATGATLAIAPFDARQARGQPTDLGQIRLRLELRGDSPEASSPASRFALRPRLE